MVEHIQDVLSWQHTSCQIGVYLKTCSWLAREEVSGQLKPLSCPSESCKIMTNCKISGVGGVFQEQVNGIDLQGQWKTWGGKLVYQRWNWVVWNKLNKDSKMWQVKLWEQTGKKCACLHSVDNEFCAGGDWGLVCLQWHPTGVWGADTGLYSRVGLDPFLVHVVLSLALFSAFMFVAKILKNFIHLAVNSLAVICTFGWQKGLFNLRKGRGLTVWHWKILWCCPISHFMLSVCLCGLFGWPCGLSPCNPLWRYVTAKPYFCYLRPGKLCHHTVWKHKN